MGWSQAGTRPRFDVVTGISTGALAAPFAYLGSDWDDELQAAYASGRADGILHARGLTDFAATSLFSPDKLRQLVDDSVTPELLRAIAVEHAQGRRLLVVTTNLDSEESVIWDMGMLATQGDEQALILFRQVLVASASIPGLFPPVMISGLIDGQRLEEMHVDGGVNMPFLALPEAMQGGNSPLPGVAASSDRAAIYVLVNGQVRRDHQVVRGYLPAILMRAYDSMSKAALRTHLVANATFAQRHGLAFRVAAIPGDHTFSSLDFAQASMQSLFELGRSSAAAGQAWNAMNAEVMVAAIASDPADEAEAQPEVDQPGE
ncbi:MAG: patatin [Alphaproteobacteria bacterium]|nr:MAG: patatin [Alphaproteobacteria bacterium]